MKDIFDPVMQANDPVDLLLLPGNFLSSYLVTTI